MIAVMCAWELNVLDELVDMAGWSGIWEGFCGWKGGVW